MKFYLVGGRGRLGQAIAAEFPSTEITLLDRSIYEDWIEVGRADKVSSYFDQRVKHPTIIFVVSGLLDPQLALTDLQKVNYHLPKNIIDGATKVGVKVVTFGTIMERLLKSKNPYVQTKKVLGEYVGEVASINRPALHLQIHTLYGMGKPSPFMFLGQILTALRDNSVFNMTSGKQLREYHHLVDEAKAIRQAAATIPFGVMDLSHGKPVSLSAIAESVFQALGKNNLHHIGALPDPVEENYGEVFKPTEALKSIQFRDTLPAIVQYMRQCYHSAIRKGND